MSAFSRSNLHHCNLLLFIIHQDGLAATLQFADEGLEFAAHVVLAQAVDRLDVLAVRDLLA